MFRRTISLIALVLLFGCASSPPAPPYHAPVVVAPPAVVPKVEPKEQPKVTKAEPKEEKPKADEPKKAEPVKTGSPCPHPARSQAAKDAFVKLHACPASGQHVTHCSGYVIDHIKPLCDCGADAPANMQWQKAADAKKKDATERALCAKGGDKKGAGQ